jgi:hypothetical protein
MKKIIKNIVATLMLSGLFFIPVLSSAQTSGGMVNERNSFLIPPINNDKSQAEIEAVKEMLDLEAKTNRQPLYRNDPRTIKSRIFTSISNVINDDKSQAEVEAVEELIYIQAISVFRKLNTIVPVQASSRQFSFISNLVAANNGEELSVLQNIR